MTNMMEYVENEIKRLNKIQRVIDLVFGSLMVAGLIGACVVCPLLMHLS